MLAVQYHKASEGPVQNCRSGLFVCFLPQSNEHPVALHCLCRIISVNWN